MTVPAAFQELIERLEKATAPDRELDREIIFAIYPEDLTAVFDGIKHISTMTGADGEPWFNPLADRDDCPHFTGSIDDALTAVPDMLYWLAAKGRTRPTEPLYAIQLLDRQSGAVLFEAEHERLEHTICIAALKAHAAGADQ